MATRLTPAALVARGALFSYLAPRLAMDARPAAGKIVARATDGVTSKNYAAQRPRIANALRRATVGRLAQDNGIEDLAALLNALKPQVEQADQAPGLGQIATNPGGSAGPDQGLGSAPQPAMTPDQGAGGSTHDIVAKIKSYLEEEGVAPEILNNIDAFLAEAGGGGDQLENLGQHAITAGDRVTPPQQGQDDANEDLVSAGEDPDLEPRGGLEPRLGPESVGDEAMDNDDDDRDDWDDDDEYVDDEDAAEDQVPEEQAEQLDGVPPVSSEGASSRVVNGRNGSRANDRRAHDKVITKSAMDRAIKLAQDAAIKNQRAIRDAERYVRAWVGDLAMDAAGPADVYRAALRALNVKGADKVHADALRPILDAQPKPSVMRAARDHQHRIAQDSAGEAKGSFLERFPDAAKITMQ